MRYSVLFLTLVLLPVSAMSQVIVVSPQAPAVKVVRVPAKHAPSSSANPLDNRGPWTSDQVDKLCYNRANNNANQFDSCVKRNASRIGKAKQPGEIAELNVADKKLTRKAIQQQPTSDVDQ